MAVAINHGNGVESRSEPINLEYPSARRPVAEHVLRVDSCWMSAINCSDGTIAKDAEFSKLISLTPLCAQDTVRSLQKESVILEMHRASGDPKRPSCSRASTLLWLRAEAAGNLRGGGPT